MATIKEETEDFKAISYKKWFAIAGGSDAEKHEFADWKATKEATEFQKELAKRRNREIDLVMDKVIPELTRLLHSLGVTGNMWRLQVHLTDKSKGAKVTRMRKWSEPAKEENEEEE